MMAALVAGGVTSNLGLVSGSKAASYGVYALTSQHFVQAVTSTACPSASVLPRVSILGHAATAFDYTRLWTEHKMLITTTACAVVAANATVAALRAFFRELALATPVVNPYHVAVQEAATAGVSAEFLIELFLRIMRGRKNTRTPTDIDFWVTDNYRDKVTGTQLQHMRYVASVWAVRENPYETARAQAWARAQVTESSARSREYHTEGTANTVRGVGAWFANLPASRLWVN
jgi:hypothetical protein